MDLRAEKDRLRNAVKARFQHLSQEDRERESRSICRRLLEALPDTPGTICVFYPMTGSEADIRPVFPALKERGWTIFFPRFEGTGFAFRRADSLTTLEPGRYGLMEPSNTNDLLRIEDVTLAIVPGLAFDRAGGRVGRGNGGYDRWIADLRAKNPNARVWGIALECQLTQDVPREAHDQTIDVLCTARECMDVCRPR